MAEMILLYEKTQVLEYFKNLEQELSLSLYATSSTAFSSSEKEIISNGRILFIEYPNKNLDKLMSNQLVTKSSIIFATNLELIEEEQEQKLKALTLDFNSTQGILDLSRSSHIHRPFIKSLFEKVPSKKSVKKIGHDLESIARSTLAQLQKVKKLHEKIVPIRSEEIKGLKLSSKFTSGEAAGGEFFDIVKGDRELALILTSSRSYFVSSLVLSHFDLLKQKDSLTYDSIKDFLVKFSKDLHNSEEDRRKEAELFVLFFNLNKMTIMGHNFGATQVISNKGKYISGNEYPFNTSFFEKTYFEDKLERGEKMAILSPGVEKNTQGFIDGVSLVEFMKSHLDNKNSKDLVNEVFYHLKKNKDGLFLDYDASVISIEVGSNVIMEI